MAEKYTISVSEGEVNLKHNIDRKYAKSHSNEYIDLSRSHLNRTIIMDERLRSGMTVEEAFNDEFSEAVSEYNSTKKKSRDKIKNYYEKVNSMKASGHKMKAVHEIVLQIGNMENNGVVNGENVEALADILDTQIKQFQEDYPDIIIWYAVGHMDEATYHVHLGYSTPVFNPDAKRGLKYKISQNECLENMGITRGTATIKNKHGQDIERTRSLKEMFYDDMKDRIEDEMIERGFSREIKDLHEQHLSPSNYRTKRLYESALGRDIQSKQRENAVSERESVLDEREASYEAEIKIKYGNAYKSKVKALESDFKARIEAKEAELQKKHDDSLEEAEKELRERLQSEFDAKKRKLENEDFEEWKAEYKNEVEREFQSLQDKLEAQKSAQDEKEKSLSEKESLLNKRGKLQNKRMREVQQFYDTLQEERPWLSEKDKHHHEQVKKRMQGVDGYIQYDENVLEHPENLEK